METQVPEEAAEGAMAGGFLSGSQALKADALDFIGDGLITLLGVLAIGWSLTQRARAALMQGVFLGLLGLGVVLKTGPRLLEGGLTQRVSPG